MVPTPHALGSLCWHTLHPHRRWRLGVAQPHRIGRGLHHNLLDLIDTTAGRHLADRQRMGAPTQARTQRYQPP